MEGKETEKDDLVVLRSGEWMNGFTDDIAAALSRCAEQCFRLNALSPLCRSEREEIVREMMGSIGERFVTHYPLNIFSEILFYMLSLYIIYLQMLSFGLNTHEISRF